MRDRLKEFVNENREGFDVFEPRPELWQEICKEMPAIAKPQRTERREAKVISINFGEQLNFSADFMFMRIAATIVLLLACGITLWMVKQNTPAATTTATVAAVSDPATVDQDVPELAEVEIYYASQINSKREELSAYDLKVLGLDDAQQVDRELARLDSSYTRLKSQLYTTPNTDQVMGAMIQNLQLRIKVLNRQLEVLKKIERMQKQDITEPKEDETTIIS